MLDGSPGWKIQNSSGTLKFNYNSTNELSLSSGDNLTLTGTLPSISKVISISSLTNNQMLQWNSSSSKRGNATVSTGGSSTLTADTDCSLLSPATNQTLIYDSSSNGLIQV